MGCLLDALGGRCWVLDFDRASGGASDEWQYVRHDLKARGSGTPASTERVVAAPPHYISPVQTSGSGMA